MPQFTITLSDKALTKLQAVVNTYNANTGQSLTVKDWIILHLKDIAIQQELANASEPLRQQAERDAQATFEAAVSAERDRLLADL